MRWKPGLGWKESAISSHGSPTYRRMYADLSHWISLHATGEQPNIEKDSQLVPVHSITPHKKETSRDSDKRRLHRHDHCHRQREQL
jgi:predicted N-formylglutamate amidohydrolase